MPLDVDKIKEKAAQLAEDAATAANSIAEQAKPAMERASAKVDELAEKGRPYVERAEKQAREAVDTVVNRVKGNDEHKDGGGAGGAF